MRGEKKTNRKKCVKKKKCKKKRHCFSFLTNAINQIYKILPRNLNLQLCNLRKTVLNISYFNKDSIKTIKLQTCCNMQQTNKNLRQFVH